MVVAQSLEVEDREGHHNVVHEAATREQARALNKEVKINSMIREVAQEAGAVDASAGETTTSHSVTETPQLPFVLAGP